MDKSKKDNLTESDSKQQDLKDNDDDFKIEFSPNISKNKTDDKIKISISDTQNTQEINKVSISEKDNKDENKDIDDEKPYSFDYSRLNQESDYLYHKSQPYLKRVFNGKNSLIIAIVALAFIILNIYRLNDPLKIGENAPNLTFTTKNGEKFDLNKIYSSKVLIFYKKHTYFSNYIFNTTYKRALPAFKILQDKGLAQVIIISKGYDNPEELSELLALEDYGYLENIMFATDTDLAGKEYGIRSWPHLYVISKDNKVIYETKLGSADKVQQILWRDF